MSIVVLISILVWIYLLTVLKRGKLDFFYFLVGSVGFFVFYMILLQPLLTAPLQMGVAAVAGALGKVTGIYESFFRYSMILISNHGESISLYIDYECSGVIEVGAFLALLIFFPLYRSYEKVLYGLFGGVYLCMANVFRIYIIGALIYVYGTPIYYVAHTIVGRIFYYSCSVILYYRIFTKAQIARQKVGNVSYESTD